MTDTAEAAIRIYEEPASRGLVINVGSGREVSINDLVALLLRALEIDVPVVHVEQRSGDVRRHLAATERARDTLGFAPRVSIADGLAQTVAWYGQDLAVPE